MVFVEFNCSNFGDKYYFVGASLSDVLADTNDGKKFGNSEFSSYREVSEQDVSSYPKLAEHIEAGKTAIREEVCKSFNIGILA